MPWPMLIVCVLAMIGAIAVALLLIPQLSTRAAYSGGSIAIGSFLATQLGTRIVARYRQRRGRG
jgi:hypothetical protein